MDYGYNQRCYGYNQRPFFGMGMPPISDRGAETMYKIDLGANGLKQIVNGINYLECALQPSQYSRYN
jgi:hypothetical protein